MNDDKHSLIAQGERQLDLLPSTAMPDAVFSAEEGSEVGEYTGARLFARDPDRYKMIVGLLAEGIGILRIARILKVSPSTVIAVRDREAGAIEIVKQQVGRAARAGAQMCVEAILEVVADPDRRKKLSLRDLGVVHGILVDKALTLAGEPTWIGEVRAAGPEHEDFERYLESLKEVPEAEVTETGFGRGNPEQKGAAAAGAAGPGTGGIGELPAAGGPDPGAQGPEDGAEGPGAGAEGSVGAAEGDRPAGGQYDGPVGLEMEGENGNGDRSGDAGAGAVPGAGA